jgi:hypothetical protein
MSLEVAPAALWRQLATLLPETPRSARVTRYMGDDHAVRLSEMSETDRSGVVSLYASIAGLERSLREDAPLTSALAAFDVDGVTELARSLGRQENGERLRQALHDVRGGALSSLTLTSKLAMVRPDPARVRSLRILAADHLKVMRNAVLELDDAQRDADRTPRSHSVGRLIATLERVASDHARVLVDSQFQGAITTSCMELGALDRAALNVVNNAVRHSASGTVHVWLAPVEGPPPNDLRLAVANTVEEEHGRALEERFGDELSRLFLEGFSTTGSGAGLGICAEFVSSAYGLARVADATQAGLLGARLLEGTFVAWLHWPAVV